MRTKKSILGYQVMPDEIMKLIYDNEWKHEQVFMDDIIVDSTQSRFANFGMSLPNQEPINIPIGIYTYLAKYNLIGGNIRSHFASMASELLSELPTIMRKTARKFARYEISVNSNFALEDLSPGWNLFNEEDNHWKSVPFPDTDWLFYDTETFVQGSSFPDLVNMPIIGTGVGDNGETYLWLHECWFNKEIPYSPAMISIGPRVKYLVAQFAPFDLTKTLEFFTPDKSKQPIVFDTLSMHNVTNALTSNQKFQIENLDYSVASNFGSAGNLIDLYNFHCGGNESKSQKDIRDLFVTATNFEQFRSKAKELISYALKDSFMLPKLFSRLVTKYFTHAPHLAHLFGMITVAPNPMPVVNNWKEWITTCEEKYSAAEQRIHEVLYKLADEALEEYFAGNIDPATDPWLSGLDWTIEESMKKVTEQLYDEEGNKVYEINPQTGRNRLKKVTTTVPKYPDKYGKPKWYNDIHSKVKSAKKLTIKSVTGHLLARLTWNDHPIVYDKTHKWIYKSYDGTISAKVPHMVTEGANVGSILSQNYVPYFEDGTIKSLTSHGKELLNLAINLCYWTSVRERVKSQTAIWSEEWGTYIIASDVQQKQTLSGRSGSRLWHTVPSHDPRKIGTELRTRISAPKGKIFITGDVDGQEAHIGANYADSAHPAKLSGATPYSYMIFAGDKSHGTDQHTITAKNITKFLSNHGIDYNFKRKDAKTLNYALQFLSGEKASTKSIRGANPALITNDVALSAARDFIRLKRGIKQRNTGFYEGGTDTEFYNDVLRRVREREPRLPMLGTLIPQSLIPFNLYKKDDELTSRFNFFSQGTGAEFLSCMLVATMWLAKQEGIWLQLVLTYHDEYMFITDEENAETAARIWMIAHLWCWALLGYNLGIRDIPFTAGFPTSLLITNKFLKEPTGVISTPSIEDTDVKYKEVTVYDLF